MFPTQVKISRKVAKNSLNFVCHFVRQWSLALPIVIGKSIVIGFDENDLTLYYTIVYIVTVFEKINTGSSNQWHEKYTDCLMTRRTSSTVLALGLFAEKYNYNFF